MKKEKQIFLSPPDVGAFEIEKVKSALESGWVAPVGPDISRFESEIAEYTGRKYGVALSSGTAALHLAYKYAGITEHDEVVVPTLTFAATVFPLTYLGARPTFIDVDDETWTLDPNLLEELLESRLRNGRLPAAIIAVDLYGATCDYAAIVSLCDKYSVPLIADAAESLGATHLNAMAGSIGDSSIISFNGNKIITTSGGGMFLTDHAEAAEKVKYWATQSRDPVSWYEHNELGYNYRLSNICCALGSAQLKRLPSFIERRHEVRSKYIELLKNIPGIRIHGDPLWGKGNAWLTIVRLDNGIHPDAPMKIHKALAEANIESRPVWKPMHQQPIFRNEKSLLTGASESIFREGLCLPSGSSLSDADIQRVVEVIIEELNS